VPLQQSGVSLHNQLTWLVKKGRLKSVQFGGRKFVLRSEVEKYRPVYGRQAEGQRAKGLKRLGKIGKVLLDRVQH
jgi:hypothetical protein